MSNHLNDIGATTVKGGLFLLLGNSLALIFDAVGAILVARMLSPSQYGIFTVALVIPNSLKLFTTWGLNQAMIRFIAQHQILGNSKKIQSIVQAGFITRFVIGGFLSYYLHDSGIIGFSLFFLMLVQYLRFNIKNIPRLEPKFQIINLALLGGVFSLFASYILTNGLWIPFTWVLLALNIVGVQYADRALLQDNNGDK